MMLTIFCREARYRTETEIERERERERERDAHTHTRSIPDSYPLLVIPYLSTSSPPVQDP